MVAGVRQVPVLLGNIVGGTALFVFDLAPRIFFDVGHSKERTPRMRPTRRFSDRSRLAPSQIELVIAVIGVGLQEDRHTVPNALRMLPRRSRE